MRKLLLGMLVLALGAVLAPATSASAATFAGACTISGTASFTGGSLTNSPQTLSYTFNSTGGSPLADQCVGSLNNGPPAVHAITANATGTGTLSCAATVSTGGSASVAFVGGPTFNFGIDLVGTATEVEFVITGSGGAGAGHATFAEEATRAQECSGAGISSIGFDVVAGAVQLVG